MINTETQVGNAMVLHTLGYWTHRFRVYRAENDWGAWLWRDGGTPRGTWWLDGDVGDNPLTRHPSPELLNLIENCHTTGAVAAVADKILEEYPECEPLVASVNLEERP